MRGAPRHLPAIARAGGFALVAVAIVATALHFHSAPASHSPAHQTGSSAAADPLAAELRRCQRIAEEAKDDPACERAWAENRRRFFTYAPAATSTPAVPPQSTGR